MQNNDVAINNGYSLKVSDFVDITEKYTSFSVDDMVHICKRKNNSKREYLFVNRYQGKHIPVSPSEIVKLYIELFERIGIEFSKEKHQGEKVVIVGFAETATAIGEAMASFMSMSNKLPVEFVYYLQTSREEYDCPKLFDFSEEHSHAVNQYLYSTDMPKEYDRVLFVEDEITTGKTILNFISEFSKINPNCKYSVASFLNWQNKESIQVFEDKEIDRIYLISGKLKDKVPSINIIENEVLDYFSDKDSTKYNEIIEKSGYEMYNSRLGLSKVIFQREGLITLMDLLSMLLDNIEKNDDIMVVGTEEFMFYPMVMSLISSVSCNFDLCNSIRFRATTRSPIVPSKMEGYEIKDGISLPSAYDASRKTYLYNLNEGKDYNKMVVITEKGVTNEFVNALNRYCEEYNIEFKIICL